MPVSKGQIVTAVGVVLGGVIFSKFLKAPLENALGKVA